jgi:O-antigen ligase
LLVLLVLTPLPYGSVEPWSIALWELVVLSLLLLWGVRVLMQGRVRIGGGWLVLPLIGLALVGVVQLLPPGIIGQGTISFDPFATSQALIRIIASLGFFLLVASFIDTDERRNTAVIVILAVCVFVALVGIGQSFIGKALWQRGTFGPFVNRNHFAGFLVMGAGLAGGMLIGRSVKRELLALYGSGLVVLCAGIVLSASRGGVLALGAAILFLALIALPIILKGGQGRVGRATILIRSVAVLLLGTGAVVGALFLVGSEGLVRNISQTQGEVEGTRSNDERFSRRDIWRATKGMISDHPWLGVGLGAFPFAFTSYDQSSGAQRVEQTHNDYLQILADAGLVGAILALTFIVLLFSTGFRAARTRDRRRRSIILGALSGCFAIGVHSFVDFNLQITANAQLFLTLVALATPASYARSTDASSTDASSTKPDTNGEV